MRDVSTTCDIILPTSKKDLDSASSVPRRQLGRSVRIDRERLSTTAVASVMAATIPMHRAVPRATSRSRLSPRRRSCLVAELDKSQATFEARRHCGHVKALRRAIPPYEGRALPAWQPQRPNWVHGLADGKHPLGSIADCAPEPDGADDGPIGSSARLGPPSLCSHGPGEPLLGSWRPRGRSLRPDGVWTVPTAGRTESPARERG